MIADSQHSVWVGLFVGTFVEHDQSKSKESNVNTKQPDVDVDVVDLRAQADASMPASNNNVKLYNISNF